MGVSSMLARVVPYETCRDGNISTLGSRGQTGEIRESVLDEGFTHPPDDLWVLPQHLHCIFKDMRLPGNKGVHVGA